MTINDGIISGMIDKLFTNKNERYIFIYSPPKVGSTTLVTSLRVSLGNSCCVIHIHDETMLGVLTGINNISINDIIQYLSRIGKTVYVIDVYRTPIERKMSEFFEKISSLHFNNSEENINKYSIERVINRFNKLLPHLENGDHYIDKYDIPNRVPFDFNKKYTIQNIENIVYVKLRLCDSSLWSSILSEVFKTDIVLITDYQSKQKQISDLYTKFKQEYMLPDNFIQLITECKYLRLYYSEEERKKYIDGWITRRCKSVIPYTYDEYKFYINICLENQYINDIQIDHYIDSGCLCKICSSKRKEIFFKAKRGEKVDKFTHTELVNNRNENIVSKINEINKITSCNRNQKFTPKQFAIKLN
jgi:hypothetical protein